MQTSSRILVRSRVAVLAPVCFALAMMTGCRIQRMNASERSGEFEWSHGPRTVVVKLLGHIELAGDDQDVAAVSPDGYLLIEESLLLDSKAIEFARRPDGAVGRRFLVSGEEKLLDAEARAWVARILPEVVRRTGMNATERAARILREQGLGALLDEVPLLASDSVRARYFEEAARSAELNPDEALRLARGIGHLIGSDSRKEELLAELAPRYVEIGLFGGLVDAADTIGSSSHKASLLRRWIERYGDAPDSLRSILTSVRTIGSDSEKASTLRSAISRLSPDGQLSRDAFFAAVDGIGSDSEKSQVLREALRNQGHDEPTLVSVLRAAGRMGSDSNKEAVLSEASRFFVNTASVRQAYFETVDRIGSTSDRSRALLALSENAALDPSSVSSLFQSAGRLESDSTKAGTLTRLLALYSEEPQVSKAFFEALARIQSNNDRAGVLLSTVRQSGVGKPTFLSVIDSAEQLDSDSAKQGALIAVARVAGADAEVSAHVRRAASTIESGSAHRSVIAELDREQTRSE